MPAPSRISQRKSALLKQHAGGHSHEAKSPSERHLQQITNNLTQGLTSTNTKVFQTGKLLIQAKELLGYGHFRQWLGEHFSMSAKTANRFMTVAQMIQRLELTGETVILLEQLELTALYELAAKSTPLELQAQVLALLQAKEPVTHESIRQLKLQAQPELLKASESAELQRFTGLLEAFSVWFKLNRRNLDFRGQVLNESFKKDLQSYSASLKEANELIEDLLEQN
jgi:hypothetical protein